VDTTDLTEMAFFRVTAGGSPRDRTSMGRAARLAFWRTDSGIDSSGIAVGSFRWEDAMVLSVVIV
jgi:hypothetical protein